jgi:hypothetical protein
LVLTTVRPQCLKEAVSKDTSTPHSITSSTSSAVDTIKAEAPFSTIVGSSLCSLSDRLVTYCVRVGLASVCKSDRDHARPHATKSKTATFALNQQVATHKDPYHLRQTKFVIVHRQCINNAVQS